MKPHIFKLHGAIVNCWTCIIEGRTSRIAGFGNCPESAWRDLIENIEIDIENDYTYGIEDVVRWYYMNIDEV